MAWQDWFVYVTDKKLKVAYWQAGMAYYVLSLLIFLFYFIIAFNSGDYMKKEPVNGVVNAYASTATHPYYSCEASKTCGTDRPGLLTRDYCRAESHNFHYSNDFKYFSGDEAGSGGGGPVGPECRFMSANQIVTKDINEISLTSVFIEEQKFGWSQGNAPDCASVSSSFATSAIAQCSSAPYQDATNGQCMCDYNTAAFPTQVENYTIAFSHTYTVHWDQGQETWTGSSKQTTSDSGYVMETTVVGFPNGTIRTYEAGEEIALTVQEILEMAEYEDENGNFRIGIQLDDTNIATNSVDMRDKKKDKKDQRLPKFRHTGIMLDVEMHYTNRQPGQVIIHQPDVDCTLSVKVKGASTANWASVGPTYFYPTYPSGEVGSQTFHSVLRYPQDIRIYFISTGYAYTFDTMKLITTIVDLVILAGLAKTIMDFIVFYCLPNGVSLVLRNKRAENTSRRQAFREMGMQAAMAVEQFNSLDVDKDQTLTLAELARVFGGVKEVDRDRAMMIAKTIMGDNDSIDFEEFMTITHGDAVTFKEFLMLVKNTGGDFRRLSLFDKEQAMKAYADVEKGITIDEPSASSSADAGAGVTAQAQVAPQPVMPAGVQRLMCHQCKRAFGVPVGAKMVACPHCAAVNNCAQVTTPF